MSTCKGETSDSFSIFLLRPNKDRAAWTLYKDVLGDQTCKSDRVSYLGMPNQTKRTISF